MAQTITGNESSLSGRMHALLNAQATRVKLYKEFNELCFSPTSWDCINYWCWQDYSAFQDYLDGQCSAEQYHSICGVVTKGFQDVSTEIQAIEREMVEEYDRTDIANMIRQLQNKEKEKLHEVNQDRFAQMPHDRTQQFLHRQCTYRSSRSGRVKKKRTMTPQCRSGVSGMKHLFPFLPLTDSPLTGTFWPLQTGEYRPRH